MFKCIAIARSIFPLFFQIILFLIFFFFTPLFSFLEKTALNLFAYVVQNFETVFSKIVVFKRAWMTLIVLIQSSTAWHLTVLDMSIPMQWGTAWPYGKRGCEIKSFWKMYLWSFLTFLFCSYWYRVVQLLIRKPKSLTIKKKAVNGLAKFQIPVMPYFTRDWP